MKPSTVCFFPFCLSPCFRHASVITTVFAVISIEPSSNKLSVIIIVKQLAHEALTFDGSHYRGRNRVSRLEARKSFVIKELVYRLEHLDIGIEINAAVVIECIETDIIGNESPFCFSYASLTY